MKRNSIIIACILVLAFALGLTGFTLAKPDKTEGAENDRLIGVFITTEHLDLFDFSRYLNDNAAKMKGGNITIDGENNKYQGRLYATLKDKSYIDPDGNTKTTQEYVFENVKGFPYYIPSDKDGNYASSGSDAISDGHTGISVTDNGVSISLDATIYVSPNGGNATYFMNPVYQSGDGRIYTTTGNGMSFSGSTAEGAAFSSKLEATNTITENGKTNSYSASVKISISVMYPPSRISLIQFSKDGSILSRTEYKPGELPHSLTVDQNCSYIILETYKSSPDEGETVSRQLYQGDSSNLDSFYLRTDGICAKQSTALIWK